MVIISTWTYLDVVVGPADAQGEPLSQTLHLATKAGLLKIYKQSVWVYQKLMFGQQHKKYKVYLSIIQQNWQVQPAT